MAVQEFVAGEGGDANTCLLVRGGVYEVDMLRRRMLPGYWPGAAHRVLRATWFLEKGSDWVPLKVTYTSRPISLKARPLCAQLAARGGVFIK